MQSSAPTSEAIELPSTSSAASSSSSPSSSSPAPTLTFSSLLSSSLLSSSSSSTSASSLAGTIGSSTATGQISPMVDSSSSPPSSTSTPLPFDVRALFDQLKQRKLHRKFRPIPSFADYRAFSRPHNSTEAWTRLELNLGWFWLNYAAIGLLVLTLAILSQPSLLLTLVVLAAVWTFALTRESIAVPGVHTMVLAGKPKLYVLYAITAVLLILFAGSTILMVAGLVGTLVAAHAVLHSTPTQEERDAEEQMEAMTVV